MNRGLITTLVVAVLLIGGYGVYRTTAQTVPTSTPSSTILPAQTPAEVVAPSSPAASTSATIVSVNNNGFSPQSVTVKVGGLVTWTNTDSTVHNVSSANHPTHLIYPTLNLGEIKPGTSVSLTFPTAGTYKYHNHIYPKLFGTVVVE